METTINPQLKDLEELIGNWEMELSNASFLSDRTAILRAKRPSNGLKAATF